MGKLEVKVEDILEFGQRFATFDKSSRDAIEHIVTGGMGYGADADVVLDALDELGEFSDAIRDRLQNWLDVRGRRSNFG